MTCGPNSHYSRTEDLQTAKLFNYNYPSGLIMLGFCRDLLGFETALRKMYNLNDEFCDQFITEYS